MVLSLQPNHRSKREFMIEFCEIGCLLCEQPPASKVASAQTRCSSCGIKMFRIRPNETNLLCPHCRYHLATEVITQSLLAHESTSPTTILLDSMDYPNLNVCGKEFLYLICGSLLSAYSHVEQDIDLKAELINAKEVTSQIPGGSCSLWTSFGTALAAKAFIDILADLRGLSKIKRKLSRHFLFKALGNIAVNDTHQDIIRCCRSNAIIILLSATVFVQEFFNVPLSLPVHPVCSFNELPRTCGQSSCLFYPNLDTKPCSAYTMKDLLLP